MKYFKLTSIVLLFVLMISSCKPASSSRWIKEENIEIFDSLSKVSKETKVLFKGKVNFYKHYVSGLLLIKPVADDCYKISLVSEIGMSIFDMELSKNGMKKLFCIAPLDKKIILKPLIADLKLIILALYKPDMKIKYWKNSENLIFFRAKKYDIKVNGFLNEEGKLYKLNRRNLFGKGQELYLSHNPLGFVNNIEIQHKLLNLKLRFKRLK